MLGRLLLVPALIASVAVVSACGDHQETVTSGESEAVYVTNGDLQYQVQISRQLNPADPGDRALLVGLPKGERQLGPDDLWFGVWVRVWNGTDSARQAAGKFEIVDTRGDTFEPVPLASVNVLAYRPGIVKANSQYPVPDSVPENLPTTGGVLVFKLPRQALDFRPLELVFNGTDNPDNESSVRLDV
ncbi:MAG: hypothetical protein FGM34_00525 [Solirubrobacteraceae bacterium]|nr:hypothetical protein [Solirubrobacteraceae bacterium]